MFLYLMPSSLCLLLPLKVTAAVTGISSNIVTATKDTANQGGLDNHFLSILQALDHQISRSTGLRQQLDPVVEPNLAVTMMEVDLQQASNSGLSFAVRKNTDVDDNAFRPGDVMTSYEGIEGIGNTRTSISLPISLFNNADEGIYFPL